MKHGYASLTYTHKPIGDKILCLIETQGGQCRNSNCEHVHVNDLIADGEYTKLFIGFFCFQYKKNFSVQTNLGGGRILLENTILSEMSRAFVGESSEDVNKYKEELSKIIMSGKHVYFDDIAKALVEFRRSKSSDRILDWYKFRN